MSDKDYIRELEAKCTALEKSREESIEISEQHEVVKKKLVELVIAQTEAYSKATNDNFFEHLEIPEHTANTFQDVLKQIRKNQRQLIHIRVKTFLKKLWSYKVFIIICVLYLSPLLWYFILSRIMN